tara:strand:+ start:65 stop:1060 length:996 start_codon:yes stop_codon:yes gene_type:complete
MENFETYNYPQWIRWILGTMGLCEDVIDNILYTQKGLTHKHKMLWDKEIEINYYFPGIVSREMALTLRPELEPFMDNRKVQGLHRWARNQLNYRYHNQVVPIEFRRDTSEKHHIALRCLSGSWCDVPVQQNALPISKYTSGAAILGHKWRIMCERGGWGGKALLGNRWSTGAPDQIEVPFLKSTTEIREWIKEMVGTGKYDIQGDSTNGRVWHMENQAGVNIDIHYLPHAEITQGVHFTHRRGWRGGYKEPITFASRNVINNIKYYDLATSVFTHRLDHSGNGNYHKCPFPHSFNDHHKAAELKKLLDDNNIPYKNSWDKKKLISAFYKKV